MLLNNIFLFMTMAFPKAGVLIASTPITIAEILFAICIIKYRGYILDFIRKNKYWTVFYGLYVFTIIIATLINLNEAPLFRIAISVVLTISPLSIGIGKSLEISKSIKIVTICLIIVGMYALVQWSFGINNTKVEGLTYAYGDTLDDKTNGYGVDGREAIKMPSTYQVGNGAGLFYILALAALISYKSGNKLLKYFAIIIGMIGLLMSGSRSAIIPFIILIPYVIYNLYKKLKTNKGRQIFLLSIILIIIISILYITLFNSELIEYAYNRYVLTTISDNTGSGRTTMIKEAFEEISKQNFFGKVRCILLGVPWEIGATSEGILYTFFKYGIITMISFLAILILPIIKLFKKGNKIMAIGLIGVFIAFCVDSSFNYPPSLINYFLLAGIFMNYRYDGKSNIKKLQKGA